MAPLDFASEVVAGGADALSVLTDPDFFGGSLATLAALAKAGVPTLMKDILVDERQLDAARTAGAAAVLLIERVLGADRRAILVRAAHDRGLEVLLETHGLRETEAVRGARADLVGVNARDLATFQVDRAEALAAVRVAADHGPTLLLSGVRDRRDVAEAAAHGATAILVGTSVLRSPVPRLAVRALRRPLAKVCGLRDADGVVCASGADLAGFILSDGSPRAAAPADLPALMEQARDVGLAPVLVTDVPDPARILAAARQAKPTLVQLHGPAKAAAASLNKAGFTVFFATQPGEAIAADAEGVVLDSGAGGSGEAHDWRLDGRSLAGRRGLLAFVAGGLDADNAPAALAASGAAGADASSRLETSPGRKDRARVRAFIAAVQGAA